MENNKIITTDIKVTHTGEKQGLIKQPISSNIPSNGKELESSFEQIYTKLKSQIKEVFSPSEGIYRINDCGDYVSEEDFEFVFSTYSLWIKYAYLLVVNNFFSLEEICQKSLEEIEKFLNSESFNPDICYYTEAEEDGTV